MSKDIIIELTRDHGTDVKGTRYGVPSVAVADKLYGSYRIVGHTDGSSYEAPAAKPSTKRKTAPKAPRAVPFPVAPDVAPEPAGDAA